VEILEDRCLLCPFAVDDNSMVIHDNTLYEGVLTNDDQGAGNSGGGPLTVILVDSPSSGSLTGPNNDGSFSFTPDTDFVGIVTFTYKLDDGVMESNIATVIIDVSNPIPMAENDGEFTVREGEVLDVSAPGVLGNDADLNGDPITANMIDAPAHGSASLNADGSFTYSPNADYVGPDSFTYKACDHLSACSTPASVSLSVQKSVGRVQFVQERGWPVPAGGGSPASDNWTQPSGYGNGSLSGTGTITSNGMTSPPYKVYSWASDWQFAPSTKWATSCVEVSNPGGIGVCNSNDNPKPWLGQSGALTAWLRGTAGEKYTVSLAVTVILDDTGATVQADGSTNHPVKASVVDYTTETTGDPPTTANCSHSTNVTVPGMPSGGYYESWTCDVTARADDQWDASGTVITVPKGHAKIVAIVPTFGAQANQATGGWTAHFCGTIEVFSIT
jgi:hypothetical protein